MNKYETLRITIEDSSVLFPVFIAEFLVILIINATTIIAFARVRHLRKRSTYLMIILTAADLLVGAVTGPLIMYHEETNGFTLSGFIFLAIEIIPIASQVNLSLISLERLHAALFPFRHCKSIYYYYYYCIIVGSCFVILFIAFYVHFIASHASVLMGII